MEAKNKRQQSVFELGERNNMFIFTLGILITLIDFATLLFELYLHPKNLLLFCVGKQKSKILKQLT